MCLGAWSVLHNGHHKSFVRMNVIGFVSMCGTAFKAGPTLFACKFYMVSLLCSFMGYETRDSVCEIKMISMLIICFQAMDFCALPGLFYNIPNSVHSFSGLHDTIYNEKNNNTETI